LKFFSQIGQDEYFIKKISKEKHNGFYLDVGANDGVFCSNTAALEYYYGWTGICIEANPKLIPKLKNNRPKSIIVHKAIWKEPKQAKIEIPIKFRSDVPGDQLGRLINIDDIDKRNENYFRNEFQGQTEIFDVETDTITNVLDSNEFCGVIDYMSLDTEGAELEALQGIDFNKIHINFMTIEHGDRIGMKEKFIEYLKPIGYKLHRINKWDIEFENSKKL